MSKIPDIQLNDECPRCKNKGEAIESIYSRMKVPGWECDYCGYIWLRHNDLNKIQTIIK